MMYLSLPVDIYFFEKYDIYIYILFFLNKSHFCVYIIYIYIFFLIILYYMIYACSSVGPFLQDFPELAISYVKCGHSGLFSLDFCRWFGWCWMIFDVSSRFGRHQILQIWNMNDIESCNIVLYASFTHISHVVVIHVNIFVLFIYSILFVCVQIYIYICIYVRVFSYSDIIYQDASSSQE